MNWWEVWDNVLAALEADAEIVEAGVADAIFLDGDRQIQIPCVTALLVVNLEEEIFAPADWQFDGYFQTMDQLVIWEKAMMRLLNQPLRVTLGEARLTSEFTSGTLLRGPERDPYYRRTLEFTITPVRSRYYRPQLAGES